MSYEVSAISDGFAPQAPLPMKEERVFEPYRVPAPRIKTPPLSAPVNVPGQEEVESSLKLSPQMAALARREQKFRQEQMSLKTEREKLQRERQELESLRAMKEKLAQDDYSGLDDLVDYGKYSQHQINKMNAQDPVQSEIKKLQEKIASLESTTEDTISKQFEAAVDERRIAVKNLVDEAGKFPRIKKANAHEAVVQHILDTWEEDSEELSVEQASKEVEEILVERAQAWKALLEDEEAPQAIEEGKRPLPPMNRQAPRSLSNALTAPHPQAHTKPLYAMNEQERYAEARRRAEAKLMNR
jgi:hypothetical protein